jgi:hypothetical protein
LFLTNYTDRTIILLTRWFSIIHMKGRSFEELIEELKRLRIRQTAVLAEIREVVEEANEADQDNNDINLVAIRHGFNVGDRVRITNKIRKPATAGTSWNENRERLATVSRITVDQVHIITDNGTRTWRAPNNLRLI